MKKVITSESAPAAIGCYSQAVQAGNFVFLSGQIALTAEGNLLADASVDAQLHQIFKNLSAVSEAAGATLLNVVKLTVYLCDMKHFDVLNEVMSQYFAKPYPARAVVAVAGLPKNVSVEIEAVLAL